MLYRTLLAVSLVLAFAVLSHAIPHTDVEVKDAGQLDFDKAPAFTHQNDHGHHDDHNGHDYPEDEDDHDGADYANESHDHSDEAEFDEYDDDMYTGSPGPMEDYGNHTGNGDHEDQNHEGFEDDGTNTPPSSQGSTNPTDFLGALGICIAADALRHLPIDRLVFKAHRRAGVLCDASSSCATPGHIVVHSGVPMMMATYCGLQGVVCTQKVMLVNSPRMTRGLRVKSNTKGLQYTALAAKYASRAEEALLRTAVRVGL